MNTSYKILLWLFNLTLVCKPLMAQVDSIKTSMKFDLGITRDQNINLWPLFRISHEASRKELQILFPIYTKQSDLADSSMKSHLIPFFWNYEDSALSDIRVGSLYYPSVLRFKNDKTREIKSIAFLQLAPKIEMLEFAKSEDGLFVENNLLFFLWSKNDVANQSAHLICFPVYWSFSEKDRKFNSLIPLFSYGSYNNRKNNYLAITPLYWHFNQGTSSSDLLFPVFYSKKDSLQNNKVLFPFVWSFKNERYKSFTLLPIYSKGVSLENERKHLMVSPFYWQFSSASGKSNLVFPIYFDRKSYLFNDTTEIKTVFPLFWTYSDNSTKHKVLFPLVWSLKTENFKSFTIVPFYSKGQSNLFKSDYLMFGLLYWKFNSPQRQSKILFPVYFNNKYYDKNDTAFVKTLFPIYWATKDNSKDNKIVFPFVWSMKNDNFKSVTFMPLYSKGQSKIDSSGHLMVGLLYWKFYSTDYKSQTILPIYWSKKKYYENDTTVLKTIFPIYWAYHNKEKNIKVFAPLGWSSKNSRYKSFTFFPIYSRGHSPDMKRKHLMLASIYWQFDKPESSKKAILPIYWSAKNYYENDTSSFKTLFPIYWASKDNFNNNRIFFPLVWSLNNANYKSFTFAPFYSKGYSFMDNREYKMVGTLYWQFNSTNQSIKTLFPVYWSKKKYDENDSAFFKTIFPFYWTYRDKEKNIKAFVPLSWSSKNSTYQSFTLLPFYSGGHSPDMKRKHFMLASIYWQFDKPESSKKAILPIYWSGKNYYDNDTSSFKTLFPIYWASKDNFNNNRIFFPLVWSLKNVNYNSFTLAPFYSKGYSFLDSSEYKMFGTLYWQFNSTNQSIKTLFPVYWSKKKYDENDSAFFKTIFPFYWTYRDKEKNIKAFFPLSWSSKNSKYQSFTLVPIYSKGHSPDMKRKHFMLASIYWQFDKPESSKKAILPIYWSAKNYYENDTSSFKTLFPFYWANKSNLRDIKVVFPISWSLNNENFKSYTFFPLFSRGYSKQDSSRHIMFSMIYWQFDSKNQKVKTLIPFYWNSKKYNQNDTSSFKTIFPIYWATENNTKANKVVFPFLWNLKNENYKSSTFLPFYSKGNSSDSVRKHLICSMIYWQFESRCKKNKTVLPIYFSQKKFYKDDTLVTKTIFPIYWANQNNSEDNKIVFPLIWNLKDRYQESFTFLPFYSKGNNFYGKSYLAITPLFWRFKGEEDTRSILFPIYSKYKNNNGDEKSNVLLFVMRRNETGQRNSNQFLWPICEFTRDSAYRYFRFAPIIWYKKTEDSKFFSIQPLYYVSKNKEFESYHVLWQLYSSKNQFGYKKSKGILWKVFFKDQYENSDYETRFLYLVYANVKKEGKVEKSIFPVFHRSEDAKGNKSFSAIFYFYNKFQRRIGDSNDYYREEKIFWFLRLRSNYKTLKREGKIEKRSSMG